MAKSSWDQTNYISLENIKDGVPSNLLHSQKRIHFWAPKKVDFFPDLLALQKKWYTEFLDDYIHKLFAAISPIQDIAGDKMSVTISDIKVWEEIESADVCKRKEMTYWGIITWKIKLTDEENNKVLFSKRANIGIMPLMTPYGSFIVNGVERVIISQVVRSYGIFYSKKWLVYECKLIPQRWPWLEMFIEKTWKIMGRINKSRKFPITALLRIFGMETDESIKEIFMDCFDEDDTDHVDLTLAKDTTEDTQSAAMFIYNKLRPGELVDPDSAVDYIKTQFLSPDRIFVGRIARRKINAKLGVDKQLDGDEANVFDGVDLVAAIKYLMNIANLKKGYYLDDSDHLANKRIRTLWEVLFARLQPVLRKFVKSVKGKLSILNLEQQIKLTRLVNFKIIDNALKSFFATSQLSQFLDQINPLSEIEHKRRITALGPWGLKRETAKFEVRDVHPSHYWRICPIQTPEWQNIGLVLYQALYCTVNEEGFLETPALVITQEVAPDAKELVNRITRRPVYKLGKDGKPGKTLIIDQDQYIDAKTAKAIEAAYKPLKKNIEVRPFFREEIELVSPERDEKCYIADATTSTDEYNNITAERVAGRHFTEMEMFHSDDITHIDINPGQIFSANTALIPFVNHNYDVRANVASNQQRQWLPMFYNEAPLVGTGLEKDILQMTHAVVLAEEDGEVIYVDGKRIKVKYKKGIKEYHLTTFKKSNQKSVINQKPIVTLGQKVKKWEVMAEWPSADDGELAVGTNIKVAFMSWEGYNFEDAIVISERLVKDNVLTSVKIEEYEIEVADTKLWPEETTNDIPWVSMTKLQNLDTDGVIRIWSQVKGGDILVGKITPKSEWELSPEEKLIQAIFWDKSKSVRDTSLYMPSGSTGKVVDVVVLDSKKGDNLMAWVRKKIKVFIAMTRKIEVWDKLANKHGNKGIISVVVPEEDMPYTADGEPVDIVFNPLWVISRMNLWQLFELQLWYIAKQLGVKFAVPSFSGFWAEHLQELSRVHNLPLDGKLELYNGKTGMKYEQNVSVGYLYILKLNHMVEDKIHARAVWPYSLITQQPLWGKARDGWQRFGEMEVWALEAYSAVYTLQEMLTIKSDDVYGRNKTYESIIKWLKPKIGWLPESFNYVTYLFKGLWQSIEALNQDQVDRQHMHTIKKIKDLGLASVWSEEEEVVEVASDTKEAKEKTEMMKNVIEELKDFGEIDD